jgi:hypothetical protein
MRRFIKQLSCTGATQILVAGLFVLLTHTNAIAQGEASAGTIKLELNKAEDAGPNCRFSFVMTNQTVEPISAASYEIVVFDTNEVINQMSVFDFGPLPVGKTVVRQFELPGLACENAAKFLINGPAGCSGEREPDHCTVPLTLSSRNSLSLIQ